MPKTVAPPEFQEEAQEPPPALSPALAPIISKDRTVSSSLPADGVWSEEPRRWRAGLGLICVGIIAGSVLFHQPTTQTAENLQVNEQQPTDTVTSVQPDAPGYSQLGLGETMQWTATSSPDEISRKAGPFIIRIEKQVADDVAAPIVHVSAGGTEVSLQGSATNPDFSHSVTLFTNRAGAPPVVMLQSFDGGAHCCNVVSLAGFSGGTLKAINLGSFDGDHIDTPRDRSHDGVADFVVRDDRFLYAFSTYASSMAPPKILNVIDGQIIDVSSKKEFRALNIKAMQSAEVPCTTASSGDARNGACAGYLAAAARVGKLNEAWPKMLTSFDATAVTDLPEGCTIQVTGDCPTYLKVSYQSYPEALLNFLKANGYVSSSWSPPLPVPAAPPPAPVTPVDEGNSNA